MRDRYKHKGPVRKPLFEKALRGRAHDLSLLSYRRVSRSASLHTGGDEGAIRAATKADGETRPYFWFEDLKKTKDGGGGGGGRGALSSGMLDHCSRSGRRISMGVPILLSPSAGGVIKSVEKGEKSSHRSRNHQPDTTLPSGKGRLLEGERKLLFSEDPTEKRQRPVRARRTRRGRTLHSCFIRGGPRNRRWRKGSKSQADLYFDHAAVPRKRAITRRRFLGLLQLGKNGSPNAGGPEGRQFGLLPNVRPARRKQSNSATEW